MREIILASQSPRRKMLLEWAEVPFKVVVKETDESYDASLTPPDIAVQIARNKALAITESSGQTILAADTIVVLDGEVIGKPRDEDAAFSTLRKLSGRVHTVITGVVIRNNGSEVSFADSTQVEFHELSDQDIRFYIEKYRPYDKAGAYAIQEWIGVTGIKSIHGDFYNVMGLPVSRVVKTLQQFG
jgi:septum formation protein